MSHVDFKKRSCRRVDFKGQGPPTWLIRIKTYYVSVKGCQNVIKRAEGLVLLGGEDPLLQGLMLSATGKLDY